MLIALTGGIGSGKSTVAAGWVRLGATEIDADLLAREVVEPGEAGLERLVAEFGHEILDKTGHLNRTKLAELSFADSSVRKRVEDILHPLIQALALERTNSNPGSAIVYTIPLFVETQSPLQFDKVVTISCPEEVRVERLVKRGMTHEDAMRRISAQATDKQREELADLIIDSNCSLEELLDRARAAYRTITDG